VPTAMRFFWLATLLLFAGGCSTYRVVSAPRTEGATESDAVWGSVLEVGDEVKITLTNNDQAEGKIFSISPKAINLEGDEATKFTHSREGYTGYYLPTVIAFDSIRILEKRFASSGRTSLLIGGIIVGCIAVLGILVGAGGGPTG